jgi:hypothetical protein
VEQHARLLFGREMKSSLLRGLFCYLASICDGLIEDEDEDEDDDEDQDEDEDGE